MAIVRALVTWEKRTREHSEADAFDIIMIERKRSSRKEIQNVPVFI